MAVVLRCLRYCQFNIVGQHEGPEVALQPAGNADLPLDISASYPCAEATGLLSTWRGLLDMVTMFEVVVWGTPASCGPAKLLG